jgi:hypothetical protein
MGCEGIYGLRGHLWARGQPPQEARTRPVALSPNHHAERGASRADRLALADRLTWTE